MAVTGSDLQKCGETMFVKPGTVLQILRMMPVCTVAYLQIGAQGASGDCASMTDNVWAPGRHIGPDSQR